MLSACLIVRNNERTIRACITSLKPWVDEIVVVDTGSTDRTAEICRELGCRVYHMTWPDSFSAARNQSLKYARGLWVFVMDSDDEIDEVNGRLLRQLVLTAPPGLMAYVGRVLCPGAGSDGHLDVTAVTQVKLFRNRPDLRFEFRIHEQILPSIRRAQDAIAFSDLFVVHAGADRTPEGYRRKLRRDVRLLKMELAERPGCPFSLFNLGMTYSDAKKYRRGVSWLRQCIAASEPGDSHLRKTYALLASSLFQLGRYDEAAEAIRRGRELYPQDTELLFREGLLFQEQGRFRFAARSYQAALATREAPHFSSLDVGLGGFKTRFNLARLYGQMGNLEAEEVEWRRVVAEAPDWREAWRALMDYLLGRAEQGTVFRVQGTIGNAVPGVPRAADGAPRGSGSTAVEVDANRQLTEAQRQAPGPQRLLPTNDQGQMTKDQRRDFAAEVEQVAHSLLAVPRLCGQGYLTLARLAQRRGDVLSAGILLATGVEWSRGGNSGV